VVEFHRYWHGPLDPPAEPWLGNVLRNFGTLNDWTDDTLPADIKGFADEQAWRSDDPRHRANCVRWMLLDSLGGIWIDHDVVPLGELPTGPWTATLGGLRTSAAVSLPAGHELSRAMIDRISSSTVEGDAPYISGDQILARMPDFNLGKVEVMYGAEGQRGPEESKLLHLWATTSRRVVRPPILRWQQSLLCPRREGGML
jgi:hypothetical protein